MNELVIKKSNFDKSLKNLDKLSKENEKMPSFKKFQEKTGPFELFDTRVKGSDMNSFASQVQESFIVVNNKINMFYQQFIEIYNAFDSLDKEYIAGIISAFNQAIEATKKAEDAQKEINKTIEILKATIVKMKEFNELVNNELNRIDPNNWQDSAMKHKEELERLDQSAEYIIATIDSYKDSHEQLVSQLKSYEEEKIKYTKNLKMCWLTSGLMLFLLILLFIFVVF